MGAVLTDVPMNEQQPQGPQRPDPRRTALIGLVFVLLLILGGLLLIRELRRVSQLQDCVMSGRSNCAPIDSRTPANP
ncbi:MAG: hypothetical protein WA446_01385 [Steroidobacteraceae bacterium]